MTQATEYKLQLASDIFYGLGYSIVFGASAIACALVPVFDIDLWAYVMLAPAGALVAYAVHLLRQHWPLNAVVRISEIGITWGGWFQADRFVPSSDIVGVVWIGKRQWARTGQTGRFFTPCWLYSVLLEVPTLSYGRSRIKLGSSCWAGPIGEARDRIIKEYGLQEVEELRVEPVFFWHSTKRQVWRQSPPNLDGIEQ